ncbi:MAG: radical SAM protein [Bacteroidota bacterium]
MQNSLREYLKDPFLDQLYSEIKAAGPIRSVSLDITHQCNLRCTGCYYFEEDMDRYSTSNESLLDNWIITEKERGTNFVTIVGGEPSLALPRLKKIYDNFKLNVATNGLIKIRKEGFENMPIGIALWEITKQIHNYEITANEICLLRQRQITEMTRAHFGITPLPLVMQTRLNRLPKNVFKMEIKYYSITIAT